MPSPPAAGELLPPGGRQPRPIARRSMSTVDAAVSPERWPGRSAQSRPSISRCHRWSREGMDRALAGQDLERRELQVVEPIDRPAVPPVGVRRSRRPCRAALAPARRQLADVDAPRRRAASRTRPRRRAWPWRPPRPAAYWRRSSSSALADQGSSSQSSTSQSVSSSSHSPAASTPARTLARKRRLESPDR